MIDRASIMAWNEHAPWIEPFMVVQDAGYKGIAGSTKNRNYLTTLLTDSPPRHNRPMTERLQPFGIPE